MTNYTELLNRLANDKTAIDAISELVAERDELLILRIKYVSNLSRAIGLLEGLNAPDTYLTNQLKAALGEKPE